MASAVNPTNLIINYIPQEFTECALESMFSEVGPVESCRIMRDFRTNYSYGYGFVNYVSPEDASNAIERLNGIQVENKRLRVSYARPPGEMIKDANLYVTNLPRNYTKEDLNNLFGQFGTIIQSNLLKDKLTGLTRGVAFVRFGTREEAQLAIGELNGRVLDDGSGPLSVRVAEEFGKQRAAFYSGWHAALNSAPKHGYGW